MNDAPAERPAAAVSRELVIANKRGLHARASAKFVKCAESFDAVVRVGRDGQWVGGTSMLGLMMLAAAQGSTILIEAEGPEATLAVQALTDLVANRFGED